MKTPLAFIPDYERTLNPCYAVTMPNITAYADGACSGNPGPGGWATLIDGELTSGRIDRVTTNNEAELFAIQQVIERCPPDSFIELHTDSRIAIGLYGGLWQTQHRHLSDAVKAGKAMVRAKRQTLRLIKVHGHAGDIGNNKVDGAARAQARIARKVLALQSA